VCVAVRRSRLFRPAVVYRMQGLMASASACVGASDFLDSVDFSMMDGESLHTPYPSLHNTFFLAGDPYPELDVTRSFDPNSVVDGAFKKISSDDALGMVPSDDALAAWTESEAAVNLGCNSKWLENLRPDAVSMNPIHDSLAFWMEHDAAVSQKRNNTSLESRTVPYSRRFQATDLPQGIPLNVCFRFQPTAYWLSGADAHVIANVLLDFLTAKVTTTITKVSHAKFSIKVNVCTDGSNCVAKLRMYSNDDSRAFALELQRRSGSDLVFNRFYQEIGCYLAARQKSVQVELLNVLEGGFLMDRRRCGN